MFDDKLSEDVNFIIRMLQTGKVTGGLDFVNYHPLTQNYISQMKHFSLNGKLTKSNVITIAEKCALVSISSPLGSEATALAKGKFDAGRVLLFFQDEEDKPNKDLIIEFGIVNFHKITSGVEVNTELGKLWLANYQGIDERINIMQTHNLPLITSSIRLSVTPNSVKTVQDIVEDSVDIVQDFLKVTSLSQLAWHDWAFVNVYEKIEKTQQHKLIFRKLSDPKIKCPKSYPISPNGYSNEFIEGSMDWIL